MQNADFYASTTSALFSLFGPSSSSLKQEFIFFLPALATIIALNFRDRFDSTPLCYVVAFGLAISVYSVQALWAIISATGWSNLHTIQPVTAISIILIGTLFAAGVFAGKWFARILRKKYPNWFSKKHGEPEFDDLTALTVVLVCTSVFGEVHLLGFVSAAALVLLGHLFSVALSMHQLLKKYDE